jgi:hypothetical protein
MCLDSPQINVALADRKTPGTDFKFFHGCCITSLVTLGQFISLFENGSALEVKVMILSSSRGL